MRLLRVCFRFLQATRESESVLVGFQVDCLRELRTTVKSRQQFQTGKILTFSRRRPHAMTCLPDTVRSISQPSLSLPRIFKTSRSKL